MNKKEIKMIGEIDFLDKKVKVYYHPDEKDNFSSVWQMRNLDSCYQGIMYMNNETGKCTYPENVVIPEQTDKDKEILPKFVITKNKKLDDKLITQIEMRFNLEYARRNNINYL